jgi:NADH-quinone oxidoreductase subunit L
MLQSLWLVPLLPLAGFVLLALGGRRLSRQGASRLGAATVGVSALLSFAIAAAGWLTSAPSQEAVTVVLWQWMDVSGLTPRIAFYLDPLSVVMMLVVTGVGFLIHLYSVEFMSEDEDASRFFAYMNLFVASMLILVLADNLLLLYLGWEGVGLCSYLLIGFWYRERANSRAAMKAFIVTRVGDAALALGLFLLFTRLGTLDIQEFVRRAAAAWPQGSALASTAAALLLIGALGKSAQLPLHTWLPDAMAGPTPVSALIHAATMVTAGVYLIARTHGLFELAPAVQNVVAIIGALTLLVGGLCALVQRDIKRVLAYSTMSQIGYMFLALGVGAYTAAIFHLAMHAFFKALLFLGAGVVIQALHEEHDLFKMGGLRKELPLTFWSFVIASASLAGFPLVTAGFYSKDWILWEAWKAQPWLWAAGITGAFLTGIYIFRAVFLAFFGTSKSPVHRRPGWKIQLPLMVLALLSIVAGDLEIPDSLGHVKVFSNFLAFVFPTEGAMGGSLSAEIALQTIAGALAIAGIYVAYYCFFRKPKVLEEPFAAGIHRFLFAGMGFDWLYDKLFVRPWTALATVNRDDFVDAIYRSAAGLVRVGNELLVATQTGRVRHYVAGIAIGTVVIIGWVLLR